MVSVTDLFTLIICLTLVILRYTAPNVTRFTAFLSVVCKVTVNEDLVMKYLAKHLYFP